MDYRVVLDKAKQVVEELQQKLDSRAQMEAINVSYFRNVLQEAGVGI